MEEFNIVDNTLSAIIGLVFADIISWYSSRISVDTQSVKSPSKNASHTFLYGLIFGIDINKQFVSSTILSI